MAEIPWTREPQVENDILDRLKNKYITDREGYPHVSDLLYCLTKAAFNKVNPLPPSDEMVLYFARGWALENLLLREDGVDTPTSECIDGIWMTPDLLPGDIDTVIDLKTTAMHPDTDGRPKNKRFTPEDSWMRQFMAYCKRENRTDFTVVIYYLYGPKLVAGRLQFTQDQIDTNWDWLQMRKTILEAYLADNKIPESFEFNEDWECKTCVYKMRCDLRNKRDE